MSQDLERLKYAIVSPFHGGSHAYWAKGYRRHSEYEWDIYSLPDKYWKWRMYGASVHLAEQLAQSGKIYDRILTTDMLDLALLKSLNTMVMPNAIYTLYMHENQLVYPWSPTDRDPSLGRDHHYGFTNYTSALVADQIIFNSDYHRQSFLDGVEALLQKMPDYRSMDTVKDIAAKSTVIGIGIDVPDLLVKPKSKTPRILWNHRWEYDKNPQLFFDTLLAIKQQGVHFELVILGSKTSKVPPEFKDSIENLKENIVHVGYVQNRDDYLSLLASCTHIPVTSNQDFFGISTVEGIAYGCMPLLPNRLAFVEHIDPQLHPICFYESDTEFRDKLIKQLIHQADFKDYSSQMQKYQWSTIAKSMDETINLGAIE